MMPPQVENSGIFIMMLKFLYFLDLCLGLGVDVFLSDPAQAIVGIFYLLHKSLVVKSLCLFTLIHRRHLSRLLFLVFLLVIHVNVHYFPIKLVILEGVRVTIVLVKSRVQILISLFPVFHLFFVP